MDDDRLYLDLKGARERLCRAQTAVSTKAERVALQEAIERIDRVGAFNCPQWSRFDEPTLGGDAGG